MTRRDYRPVAAWACLAAGATWFVTLPRSSGDAWWLENYNVGVRLLEAGDVPRAQTALEAAYRHVPESAETNFALGNLWYAKGDRQNAKMYYREALKRNPSHPDLLNNIGVIALEEKFYAEAERLFQAALKREPEDAKTWFLLARTGLEAGKLDLARSAIAEAMRRDPSRKEFAALQAAIPVEPTRN